MSILWIVAGLVCLIPAAWLFLMLAFHLLYWLLANNIIEFLTYPAIFGTAIAGAWMVLHGVHVL